jgi:hypothetical protein
MAGEAPGSSRTAEVGVVASGKTAIGEEEALAALERRARRCNAAPVQHLVGRPVDDRLVAEAKRLAGAGLVRISRPGEPVTLDHHTGRLNLLVDASGRITSIDCG